MFWNLLAKHLPKKTKSEASQPIITVCLQFLAHKNQFEVLTAWFLKFLRFGMWHHGCANFEGSAICWNASNCLLSGMKTAITNWSLTIHLLFLHKFFHGLSVNYTLSQAMSFVVLFCEEYVIWMEKIWEIKMLLIPVWNID